MRQASLLLNEQVKPVDVADESTPVKHGALPNEKTRKQIRRKKENRARKEKVAAKKAAAAAEKVSAAPEPEESGAAVDTIEQSRRVGSYLLALSGGAAVKGEAHIGGGSAGVPFVGKSCSSRADDTSVAKAAILEVEERPMRGLFKCDDCGNRWVSDKAFSDLAEYCRARSCTAFDRQKGTFPFQLFRAK